MFQEYPCVVFVDAMVVLEGKELDKQTWREIHSEGPILVLFVPQVLKEIDQKKRDGRLGKHARAFNRLVAQAALTGKPIKICDANPRVDICLAVTSKIDWQYLDDLDPDEGDARVIAQIVHAKGLQERDFLFLSHDINPIAMATRRGISVLKLQDSWLRPPEPSPHQKEVTQLKNRLVELESTQPKIQVGITFLTEKPFVYSVIKELEENEKNALIRSIITRHPPKKPQVGLFNSPFDTDHTYSGRRVSWERTTLPRFAKLFHQHNNNMYAQVEINIQIENVGAIQAEDMVVNFNVIGGTLSDRWLVCSHYPPPPVIKTNQFLDPLRHLNSKTLFPTPVGIHEIIFEKEANDTSEVEIHCADFRHGRLWEYRPILRVDHYLTEDIVVNVEITASNMRGNLKSSFACQHVGFHKASSEVYDFSELRHVAAPPMEAELNRSFETGLFGRFEFIPNEDDDSI